MFNQTAAPAPPEQLLHHLHHCLLTFDGDHMLPDLVLEQRLLDPLQQLVDGVDVGMDRLEPLDLGPDGGRVGQMLLVVHG